MYVCVCMWEAASAWALCKATLLRSYVARRVLGMRVQGESPPCLSLAGNHLSRRSLVCSF